MLTLNGLRITCITMLVTSQACFALMSGPDKRGTDQPGDKTGSMNSEILRESSDTKLITGRSIDTKTSNIRTVRGRLASGQPQLSDGSYYEAHSLELNAGDRVIATMRSTEFDPYLILVQEQDSSFRTIAENDDFEGLNAQVSARAETSGRYRLIANSAFARETGSYQLTVEVRPSSTGGVSSTSSSEQGEPIEIRRGQALSGNLSDRTSHRLRDGTLYNAYSFDGRVGEVVEISLSSSEFDAFLILADESGEYLAIDDDSGDGLNSLIRITLPYSGRYGILANCIGRDESGRYSIRITSIDQAREGVAGLDYDAVYPGGGLADNRYALLIGIDDYPGTSNDLASCVADTRVMRQMLIDHFGYKPENIVVINDANATREHIIQAFRRHLGQAGRGGAALFYFSGHGMQMDGNYGVQDEESDGVDEAIFVWGHGPAASIILDDEINVLMNELNTGTKLAILDNCNAGTGTLGAGFKFVSLDDPAVKSALRFPDSWEVGEVLADGSSVHGSMNHILIAACKDEETALAGNRGRPSVFTQALVRQIEGGNASLTIEDYIRQVRISVQSYIGDVLSIEHNQTPQLEGNSLNVTVSEAFGVR